MRVVSDTGPILSFARARRADIRLQVLGEIIIPEAVWVEIIIGGKEKPGAIDGYELMGSGSARLFNFHHAATISTRAA